MRRQLPWTRILCHHPEAAGQWLPLGSTRTRPAQGRPLWLKKTETPEHSRPRPRCLRLWELLNTTRPSMCPLFPGEWEKQGRFLYPTSPLPTLFPEFSSIVELPREGLSNNSTACLPTKRPAFPATPIQSRCFAHLHLKKGKKGKPSRKITGYTMPCVQGPSAFKARLLDFTCVSCAPHTLLLALSLMSQLQRFAGMDYNFLPR